MKIVYATTLGTWGGVATYLTSLIRNQVNQNNEVWLIVGSNEEFTNTIKKRFPLVHIIILPYLMRDIHVFSMFKAIYYFRQLIKKIKPDIIHLNCIMAGIMGRLACIKLNTPIIYNAHGWAFEPGTSKKYKWPSIIIEKILAYFTTKIICVSNYEEKIAKKYNIFKNNNQGIVIKNGASDVKKSLTFKKLNDNIFRITMAARFWEQKDQIDLIYGFYILTKKILPKRSFRLYLLGDGPTLNKCKKLAHNLNIENEIIFTGKVQNVMEYYNNSDIITLITHYDAISISLIEALSMGKPIVASKVGGVPENFQHNGYCINNNPHEIAYYLGKLVNDSNLRNIMGKKSRQLYLNNFTNYENLIKHNKLYNDLYE